MFDVLRDIEPHERRAAGAGFLTLVGLMSGHLLVETARDAVFLANLPATNLPPVYIAIAVVSLGAMRLQRWVGERCALHRALMSWMGMSAASVAVLWFVLDDFGDAGLYVLYVLPGVLLTVSLVQFWGLVSDSLTMGRAKRLYLLLGAGAGVGAIVGSAGAAGLTTVMPAADLLLLAAGIWAVTPLGAWWMNRELPDPVEGKQQGRGSRETGWEALKELLADDYTRGIVLLAVLLPMAATVGDYLFKSLAADRILAASLGTFFGSVYLVLNILSLGIQLFAVRRVVRRLSLGGALAVLPGLMALGGLAVAGGLAFIAAIATKVADGALRHSLYETSEELLYVPLPEGTRARTKAVSKAVGQRGGQALASLGLMGLIYWGAGAAAMGGALAVLAGAAVLVSLRLRSSYVEVFRSRLRDERLEHLFEYPELDVESLEAVLARLNSSDDAEVVAAIDLLESEGRVRSIPVLILYHPSQQVVLRALSAFIDAGVGEILPVVERLEEDAPPTLHATLLSARMGLAADRGWLEDHLDHDSPVVRAAAGVHLVARGWREKRELGSEFEDILREGTPPQQRALAFAVGVARTRAYTREVAGLLENPDAGVRQEAVRTMTRVADRPCMGALRERLVDRRMRRTVIRAFLSFEQRGFEFLVESLDDEHLDRKIRWQLPKAIGRFGDQNAARVLAERLPKEDDRIIRTRLVRELERLLLIDEDLELPEAPLRESMEGQLGRAFQLIDWRLQFKERVGGQAAGSEVVSLLSRVLEDKEAHARNLAVRLMALVFPGRDIDRARRGLRSSDPVKRASARELLEAVLPVELGAAVVGLVDDRPDEGRLRSAGRFYEPEAMSRRELLGRLVATGSPALVRLVVRFAGPEQLESLDVPGDLLEEQTQTMKTRRQEQPP